MRYGYLMDATSQNARKPKRKRRWIFIAGILAVYMALGYFQFPVWERWLELDLNSGRLREIERHYVVWRAETPCETWVSRILTNQKTLENQPKWVRCTYNSRTLWTRIHATCFYSGVPTQMKLLEALLDRFDESMHPIIASAWMDTLRNNYSYVDEPYSHALVDAVLDAPTGTKFEKTWLEDFHAKRAATRYRSKSF